MLLASQSNFLCPPSIATKFMSKTFLFSNFSYVLFSPSLCFSLSLSLVLCHTQTLRFSQTTPHTSFFSLYFFLFHVCSSTFIRSLSFFLSFFFLLLSSLSNMHTHTHTHTISFSLSLSLSLHLFESSEVCSSGQFFSLQK